MKRQIIFETRCSFSVYKLLAASRDFLPSEEAESSSVSITSLVTLRDVKLSSIATSQSSPVHVMYTHNVINDVTTAMSHYVICPIRLRNATVTVQSLASTAFSTTLDRKQRLEIGRYEAGTAVYISFSLYTYLFLKCTL